MDATTLTEKQIIGTVGRMRISEEKKAVLIRRALAGDLEARFVVFAKRVKEASKLIADDLARVMAALCENDAPEA